MKLFEDYTPRFHDLAMRFCPRFFLYNKVNELFKIFCGELGSMSATGRWEIKLRVNHECKGNMSLIQWI